MVQGTGLRIVSLSPTPPPPPPVLYSSGLKKSYVEKVLLRNSIFTNSYKQKNIYSSIVPPEVANRERDLQV